MCISAIHIEISTDRDVVAIEHEGKWHFGGRLAVEKFIRGEPGSGCIRCDSAAEMLAWLRGYTVGRRGGAA